ncbi:MAG: AfsR/SARP family transcriptional regulator, partial [Frankia sp.]
MRFEILGPLRIVADGEVSGISAPKMELLLAILLTQADQTISSEQLIDQIWTADAPRRATATLYVHISHLRKALARPHRPGTPIVTQPTGYQMDTSAEEVDARDFHTLVDAGRRHCRAGRPGAAIDD